MPTRYLIKNLNQIAVYWGNPTPGGYGGHTFDDPIEISVRWEDRQELFIDAEGKEVRSQAVVTIDRDLVLGGYLALMTLSDLSSAEEGDPQGISDAKEIRAMRKIPNIKATAYRRRVWL